MTLTANMGLNVVLVVGLVVVVVGLIVVIMVWALAVVGVVGVVDVVDVVISIGSVLRNDDGITLMKPSLPSALGSMLMLNELMGDGGSWRTF